MNENQNVNEASSILVEAENRENFVDFIAKLIEKYSNVLLDKCNN